MGLSNEIARARRLSRALVASGVAVAALGAAPLARAATPLETAKELTAHASVEYKVGHFEQALELYSKAYESYPTPALLFNIGQCHKMLKNYERAIYFFHGYLRDAPNAPNRAFVEQLMAEAQRDLDAQRAAEAAAAQRRAAEQASARPSDTPAPSSAVAPPTAPPDKPPPPPPERGPALRIAGITTAGVGVALVATGVYFGLHSKSLANDVSGVSTSRGTWSAADQSEYDSGKSAATAANIFFAVGAVALATGGVLAVLGWPKPHDEARPPAAAAIVPTPGGAAAVLVGRF